MIMEYYASAKLLLFGEYLVLKGSECLAIPLKFGQKLTVEEDETEIFSWTSCVKEDSFFSLTFSKNLEILQTNDDQKAALIQKIFLLIKQKKPSLFARGMSFRMNADFSMNWGLGSSSTLISCLSQWSETDPFELLEQAFGGSGYDIACARAETPIIYKKGKDPVPAYLFPKVTSRLLFIYTGKKQNSANEVAAFSDKIITQDEILHMSSIINNALKSTQIEQFEESVNESEVFLSRILNRPALKEVSFNQYPHSIKSLGAWGGDFFMATYRKEADARQFFKELGYHIQFTYPEIIKR